QAPHHVALFGGQVFHRGIGVALEKLAHLLAREAVQEAVEPQAPRAALEVEDVITQTAPPPSRSSSAGSSSGGASSRAHRARGGWPGPAGSSAAASAAGAAAR